MNDVIEGESTVTNITNTAGDSTMDNVTSKINEYAEQHAWFKTVLDTASSMKDGVLQMGEWAVVNIKGVGTAIVHAGKVVFQLRSWKDVTELFEAAKKWLAELWESFKGLFVKNKADDSTTTTTTV